MGKVEYRKVPGYPAYRVGTDSSIWSKWNRGVALSKFGPWRKINGTKNPKGYIILSLYKDKEGSKPGLFLLHRLLLLVFKGDPPPNRPLALHKDDDRNNNSLDNLYWGSQKRNMKDAVRNGKIDQVGEKNHSAVFTELQVKRIRYLRAQKGYGARKIARIFKVNWRSIQYILSGVTWKHIQVAYKREFLHPTDLKRGSRNAAAKLDESHVRKIIGLRNRRWSQQKIADLFEVHQTVISAILRGKKWQHVTGL